MLASCNECYDIYYFSPLKHFLLLHVLLQWEVEHGRPKTLYVDPSVPKQDSGMIKQIHIYFEQLHRDIKIMVV